MPEPEQYDVVIIGSGHAGMWLAWHMGQAGGCPHTAIREDASITLRRSTR
jgi:glycine/D-amino acid oxidase-like deaminating enzyme